MSLTARVYVKSVVPVVGREGVREITIAPVVHPVDAAVSGTRIEGSLQFLVANDQAKSDFGAGNEFDLTLVAVAPPKAVAAPPKVVAVAAPQK